MHVICKGLVRVSAGSDDEDDREEKLELINSSHPCMNFALISIALLFISIFSDCLRNYICYSARMFT